MVRKAKIGSDRKDVCQLLILKQNYYPSTEAGEVSTILGSFPFFCFHIKVERENISTPNFVLHLRIDYQNTDRAY